MGSSVPAWPTLRHLIKLRSIFTTSKLLQSIGLLTRNTAPCAKLKLSVGGFTIENTGSRCNGIIRAMKTIPVHQGFLIPHHASDQITFLCLGRALLIYPF